MSDLEEDHDFIEDDDEAVDSMSEHDDSEDGDDDIEEKDEDESCVMNLTSNRQILDDVIQINELKKEKHASHPIMTKYEFTKILGLRSQQICEGAVPMVEVPDGVTDSTEIALLEMKQKKIPYNLKREFSENHPEFWMIKDLQINFM